MFFIVLVLLVIAGGMVLGLAGIEINSRLRYELPRSKMRKLSWPAQEIIKAYHQLPAESQRYGNLYHMLSALDTKYGKDAVNNHFTKSSFGESMKAFSVCRPSSYRTNEDRYSCSYKEYHNIKHHIEEISAAHADRLHAIQMAGIAGGLDAVSEFTQQLREERDLIKETTKELT